MNNMRIYYEWTIFITHHKLKIKNRLKKIIRRKSEKIKIYRTVIIRGKIEVRIIW